MDAPSDLVLRMLRGDRTSFDDIVARYSGDVLRLCKLLLMDTEEAKDVFQEAMLRLVRLVKKNRFRSRNGSIKGFLMTTARNLCIDRLKQRADFRSIDEDDVFLDTALHDFRTPDRVTDETRFKFAFQNALVQLPDAQRTVLVLHEVSGESHKQIAARLNISGECVRSHLYLARRRLRLLLARFDEP
ncbi:MAG: RNA polymerase sigma factor [bacterium]